MTPAFGLIPWPVRGHRIRPKATAEGSAARLEDDGVALVLLVQAIDTSAAIGRMFFQILGALAEFEHALMPERTMDGLAAAVAQLADALTA
ncbi:recombinase family protein [Streptomyces sp. XH2]|uniref:recombinase family protein n=1 Tax=Streptomyces sp. XH2 TaxID=3412483 RepID=UPI003C79D40C